MKEEFYCTLYYPKSPLRGGGGGTGVHAYNFGKNEFKLGVEGEGQDTCRHFEGGFGSMRTRLPMRDLRAKLGRKPKTEIKEIKLSYFHYSICLKKRAL